MPKLQQKLHTKRILLLRCMLLVGIFMCAIGTVHSQLVHGQVVPGQLVQGQLSSSTETRLASSSHLNKTSLRNRTARPNQSMNNHPTTQPVLFGRVNPIVWGLFILLSTLYAMLALTYDDDTAAGPVADPAA